MRRDCFANFRPVTDPMGSAGSHLHKLVKCLNVYLDITPRCGVGLFAAKAFARGTPIIVDEDGDYYEDVLTLADALSRGHRLSEELFQIGADAFLLPNGNLDDFVNHSCQPNTGLRLTRLGYRMVALVDVAAGDELTYDYSTYIGDTHERLICACGSVECRGVVGPFRELPPRIRRYYLANDVVGRFAVPLEDEISKPVMA